MNDWIRALVPFRRLRAKTLWEGAMDFLSKWLTSDGLMPHGFCYQWNPSLIWLHALADTLIALSYFSIAVALVYFARKRPRFPFGWVFICFGIFTAACGATHVMDVWTLWVPSYWFSGGVKIITAMTCMPTAIYLAWLMPAALRLPFHEDLIEANDRLKRQTDNLKESEERFRQMADNIQEVFWMMNPESKEATYVSPAFEQMSELSLDTLYSNPKSYGDLIHPQDRQRVLSAIEKLEDRNHLEEEFRIVCPSGAVKWIRAIGFTARDPAGNGRTFVGTAQEITARKEMELALRESEDLYRDLVEHSTDLICTYNLEGRLLSVNTLPAKLLGYSQAELLDQRMRDFLLPEARAQFDESLLNIQRDGFVKGLMVVLTKTGERRIWEYHNTLRTVGVTAPVVRGIAHDVTDQRRIEKALRLSEEKFSKAFRHSPTIVSISTLEEGRFLEVNETFERHCGYRRDEIIGHTALELRLWIDPLEREALLDAVRKEGRTRDQETNFRTKSGEPAVFLLSVELIELEGEQCLLAVGQDITERKRVEKALRRTEEQFNAILNYSPNLIYLKDVEGRYLLINREYINAFHVNRDQICGKKDTDMFPPDQAAVFHQSDLEVLRARVPLEFEEVTIHDDGPHTSIVQKFPLFDESGQIYAICGFVIDITERKRMEEELRCFSGRLLHLQDDERRRIARGLHDSTGQNLVALATMLGQLRSTVRSTERNARRLISECKALADRCIREVRTLSYLLHPPMLEEAGLGDAIREYVMGFSKRSGIRVTLELSSHIGRMTRDVELALFRVVQEGLTNIQRHSGSRQANIRIDRNANFTLEISDEGRGIRSGRPKRKDRTGFQYGVGIPSMQERVKLIGGQLEVDSSNRGTSLRVIVPLGELQL